MGKKLGFHYGQDRPPYGGDLEMMQNENSA